MKMVIENWDSLTLYCYWDWHLTSAHQQNKHNRAHTHFSKQTRVWNTAAEAETCACLCVFQHRMVQRDLDITHIRHILLLSMFTGPLWNIVVTPWEPTVRILRCFRSARGSDTTTQQQNKRTSQPFGFCGTTQVLYDLSECDVWGGTFEQYLLSVFAFYID